MKENTNSRKALKGQKPLVELTDLHRTIIGRLVYGEPDAKECKPQSVAEIADALKIRRAHIRDLMGEPLFKAEVARQTDNLRKGAHPEAVQTMIGLLKWAGNTPADANVKLNAAKAVLGDDVKNPSVTVNNQVNIAYYDWSKLSAEELETVRDIFARITIDQNPARLDTDAD